MASTIWRNSYACGADLSMSNWAKALAGSSSTVPGFRVRQDEAEEVVAVGGPGAGTVGAVDFLADPAALTVEAGDFRAHGPAGEEALAVNHHVAVDAVERLYLIGGETVGLVGPGGAERKIAGGFKVAAEGVVDEAVFEAVLGVALFVDFGGKQCSFAAGKGLAFQPLHPIRAGEMLPVCRGRRESRRRCRRNPSGNRWARVRPWRPPCEASRHNRTGMGPAP